MTNRGETGLVRQLRFVLEVVAGPRGVALSSFGSIHKAHRR